MNLTPGQRQLLLYWGEIQGSVSQRASTATLWANVRTRAAQEGNTLSGVTAIDMGVLRAIASRQRNTMELLARQTPETAITGAMIATDVSARDQRAQNLAPTFIVRFEHDVVQGGQLTTLWRSSVFDGALPPTVGALRTSIETDAGQLVNTYEGQSHVGVGRIQISAV